MILTYFPHPSVWYVTTFVVAFEQFSILWEPSRVLFCNSHWEVRGHAVDFRIFFDFKKLSHLVLYTVSSIYVANSSLVAGVSRLRREDVPLLVFGQVDEGFVGTKEMDPGERCTDQQSNKPYGNEVVEAEPGILE